MILFEFVYWYYVRAPATIWRIWRDFVVFFFDFFGFRQHLRTLFRPWHAMVLRNEGSSRLQMFFFALFSRILGSAMGFFVRIITLIFGSVLLLITLVSLPLLEIAWIFLPVGVVVLFVRGLTFF